MRFAFHFFPVPAKPRPDRFDRDMDLPATLFSSSGKHSCKRVSSGLQYFGTGMKWSCDDHSL
jgi:hypothetical protein